MEGLTTSSPRVMQSLRNGPKKRAQKRFGFVPKPVDKPYHALTPQKTKAWKIQALCHSLSLLVFAVFASKLRRDDSRKRQAQSIRQRIPLCGRFRSAGTTIPSKPVPSDSLPSPIYV